jgi:hypothetical protein
MKNAKKPSMGKQARNIASICRSDLWLFRDITRMIMDINEIPRGAKPTMLINPLSRHAREVTKPEAIRKMNPAGKPMIVTRMLMTIAASHACSDHFANLSLSIIAHSPKISLTLEWANHITLLK